MGHGEKNAFQMDFSGAKGHGQGKNYLIPLSLTMSHIFVIKLHPLTINELLI